MLIQKSFQVPAMTTTKVYNCVRTYISSNYYNLLHEIQTIRNPHSQIHTLKQKTIIQNYCPRCHSKCDGDKFFKQITKALMHQKLSSENKCSKKKHILNIHLKSLRLKRWMCIALFQHLVQLLTLSQGNKTINIL